MTIIREHTVITHPIQTEMGCCLSYIYIIYLPSKHFKSDYRSFNWYDRMRIISTKILVRSKHTMMFQG